MLLCVTMLLALLLVLSLSSGTLCSESSSIIIHYRVWEEQPSGTRVGRLLDDLRQRDEVGPLEDFQVVEQVKALPFSVMPRDGVISTQGRLDREALCRGSDLCEVAFSVLYRKSGSVNCLRIRVEVMDLNDHSPSFPNTTQEVEISETAPLRMRIPLDRAVDLDAGPNGLQTYSLSVNQHFALDVTDGSGGSKQAELVVIKELDREVQDSFDLILVAYDKGNPPKSGSMSVHVVIQDSNDNSPAFENSSPTVTLSENTPIGTTIFKLTATDPDLGANGEVKYWFSKHTPAEFQKLFHVDSQTGEVIVKAPLDYEREPYFVLNIQAIDHGPNSMPTHCKLHIKLVDVNDHAPRISTKWLSPTSAVPTVREGAPIDTFLALVTVYDADSGKNGEVSLTIQAGSGPFHLKSTDHFNYLIVTKESLDREKVNNYTIKLIAQDHGNPSLVTIENLPVSVLDENDNAPVFLKSIYKTSVTENNFEEDAVLEVKASDDDQGLNGKVSYKIKKLPDQKSFSIHPTTGVIRVLRSLDHEESQSYSFIVEAVDYGHPPLTGSTTVHIDVEDLNDNNPVIKEPKPRNGVVSVSIPVNAQKGEIVTELGNDTEKKPTSPPISHSVLDGFNGFPASTIKAEDPDSGLNGQLKYMISNGNTNGLFWMDEDTGQLFVNATNATELIGRTFEMELSVADMGTPSCKIEATLEVTFINLQDHLKNSSPGNRGQLSFTMMMAICLSATCLLLLLAIALLTTFCRPEKRDNRAYNCRQAESSYTRHPRRPQKNIRKSDIQLIPVIRGRKEEPSEEDSEVQPLTSAPLPEDQQIEKEYNFISSVMNTSFHSQSYSEVDSTQHVGHHCKTLRKPGNIEIDGTLTLTPATSYQTLCKTRNPSSSSSSLSHFSTLKRNKLHPESEESRPQRSTSQATLRRPKMSDGQQDAEHQQMLRNLVRLSMAAFGDTIELSSASPEVQISQLLSLLRQGQLQPRTNFRGNKYSHRNGRYGGHDCSDWQSTKDSGHGESEAGDVDWEAGRDSPIDPQLEEGLNNLLNSPDDVFSEISDPAWMARLSLPLTADYHDNVFVPNGPPSPESEILPRDGLNSTSSFSTFGKTPEKDGQLGGALLSEVSTLFEMLMTQKADAHPGPRPDILYRLSAAYQRSLGLDATTAGGSAPKNCSEKRPAVAGASKHQYQ
ncbi:protocadherin-12 isoform X2 [Poeciliopsis prolifica]|uniref:protocadherin-12 isoform X2 n=1 Tax=Poeciliopsis prolifica TaxID=188132 RepID=UPI0024139DBD|nr:protocadherin-12 isoform X2 [Poeciliopsis prolifica]